jgi:hypothetical protein
MATNGLQPWQAMAAGGSGQVGGPTVVDDRPAMAGNDVDRPDGLARPPRLRWRSFGVISPRGVDVDPIVAAPGPQRGLIPVQGGRVTGKNDVAGQPLERFEQGDMVLRPVVEAVAPIRGVVRRHQGDDRLAQAGGRLRSKVTAHVSGSMLLCWRRATALMSDAVKQLLLTCGSYELNLRDWREIIYRGTVTFL